MTICKTPPLTQLCKDVCRVIVWCLDADKQMAINIFLGVYKPGEGSPDIWDLTTDYYLHHTLARVLPSAHPVPNHAKWWDSELIQGLPLPLYRGTFTLVLYMYIKLRPSIQEDKGVSFAGSSYLLPHSEHNTITFCYMSVTLERSGGEGEKGGKRAGKV